MAKSAIDPCPFCGERERMDVKGDYAAKWVHCWCCGASGPTVSLIGWRRTGQTKGAIARWNAAPRPGAGEGER